MRRGLQIPSRDNWEQAATSLVAAPLRKTSHVTKKSAKGIILRAVVIGTSYQSGTKNVRGVEYPVLAHNKSPAAGADGKVEPVAMTNILLVLPFSKDGDSIGMTDDYRSRVEISDNMLKVSEPIVAVDEVATALARNKATAEGKKANKVYRTTEHNHVVTIRGGQTMSIKSLSKVTQSLVGRGVRIIGLNHKVIMQSTVQPSTATELQSYPGTVSQYFSSPQGYPGAPQQPPANQGYPGAPQQPPASQDNSGAPPQPGAPGVSITVYENMSQIVPFDDDDEHCVHATLFGVLYNLSKQVLEAHRVQRYDLEQPKYGEFKLIPMASYPEDQTRIAKRMPGIYCENAIFHSKPSDFFEQKEVKDDLGTTVSTYMVNRCSVDISIYQIQDRKNPSSDRRVWYTVEFLPNTLIYGVGIVSSEFFPEFGVYHLPRMQAMALGRFDLNGTINHPKNQGDDHYDFAQVYGGYVLELDWAAYLPVAGLRVLRATVDAISSAKRQELPIRWRPKHESIQSNIINNSFNNRGSFVRYYPELNPEMQQATTDADWDFYILFSRVADELILEKHGARSYETLNKNGPVTLDALKKLIAWDDPRLPEEERVLVFVYAIRRDPPKHAITLLPPPVEEEEPLTANQDRLLAAVRQKEGLSLTDLSPATTKDVDDLLFLIACGKLIASDPDATRAALTRLRDDPVRALAALKTAGDPAAGALFFTAPPSPSLDPATAAEFKGVDDGPELPQSKRVRLDLDDM